MSQGTSTTWKLMGIVFALCCMCVPLVTGSETHANNFGVIVCTSRFWFNYRHVSNALAVYHTMKRFGVPDSNIVLMLAEDAACNERNPFPSHIYSTQDHRLNIYDTSVEVDYRGSEVTVENFLRVITGRHFASTPPSQRLLTDNYSNVLVYLTGHGGDGFLKFQDKEELTSQDLADAFAQMYQQHRYHELMFVIDTCQAATMFSMFYSPAIISIASSRKGENSYAYGSDGVVGVALVDRFTHFLLEYLEGLSPTSNATVQDLLENLQLYPVLSTSVAYTGLLSRDTNQVLLMDFFANSKHQALISHSQQVVDSQDNMLVPVTTIHNDGNNNSPNNNNNKPSSDEQQNDRIDTESHPRPFQAFVIEPQHIAAAVGGVVGLMLLDRLFSNA